MEMLNIAESFQSSTTPAHGYKTSAEDGGASESFSDAIRQEILGSDTSVQQGSGRTEEHSETDSKEEGDKDTVFDVQGAILWTEQLQSLQMIPVNQNLNSDTGEKAIQGLQQTVAETGELSQVHQGLQKGTERTDLPNPDMRNPVLHEKVENPLKLGSIELVDSVVLTADRQETSNLAEMKGFGHFEANAQEQKKGVNNNVHNLEKQVSPAGADQNAVQGRVNQIQEDTLSQAVASQSRPEAGFYTGIQQDQPTARTGRSTLTSDIQNLSETMLKQMTQGKTDFEILLEPANLGKLIIKVTYESGKAAVSILCTNDKTLEMLSQNAKNMGAIMEQRMGTETTVVIEPRHTNPDYLQQQADQGSHSGYERDDQQQNQSREKENEYIGFAEQLRLGLM